MIGLLSRSRSRLGRHRIEGTDMSNHLNQGCLIAAAYPRGTDAPEWDPDDGRLIFQFLHAGEIAIECDGSELTSDLAVVRWDGRLGYRHLRLGNAGAEAQLRTLRRLGHTG